MKSRILCISTHTSPTHGFGGPSVSFRNLIDYFNSENINYTLLTTNPYKLKIVKNLNSREIYFPTYLNHKLGFSIIAIIYIFCTSMFSKRIITVKFKLL